MSLLDFVRQLLLAVLLALLGTLVGCTSTTCLTITVQPLQPANSKETSSWQSSSSPKASNDQASKAG